jgi:Ca-activated chloride channel family protein
MTWDFAEPSRLWLLLGVVAVLAAYVVGQFQRRRYAVRFASSHLLDKVAPRRAGWPRHVLAALFLLGLSTAVLASAQPQAETKVPKQRATIMLALDTSLSMKATDVSPTRIAAAKAGATRFVKSIPKKLNVGLVSFDGDATVDVSPTTDRSQVTRAISSLKLNEGTAIGDAVTASLHAIQSLPKAKDGKKVPAVIVLLSDGATTVGRPTADAIPEAKKAGVAVYTIAYGTPDGVVDVTIPGTGEQTRIPVPVDSQALADLAQGTGGKSFTAQSASDLKSVYQQLGSSIGYDTEYTDISWQFALAAAAFLMVSGMVAALWFQRLP